jgi:cyclic dehypoxanthinyl futalosine synthase
MHPDLGIEWYEEMLRGIKEDNPGIHVHGFGPPEIVHIARSLRA